MVPIGSIAECHDITGPYRVLRYNLYPAAEVQGSTLPGYSTGYALAAMAKLAADRLPDGFGFDWTDLAYQQKIAGNTGLLVFVASIVFVFPVLAAQYESWSLPFAVILIVPMCLLAAVSGLLLRGDGRQRPGAGRVSRAGRARHQERDPDRRIRATGRGRRRGPLRCRRAGSADTISAHPGDLFRLYRTGHRSAVVDHATPALAMPPQTRR
jgi:hypothetical protein